jgi:type IV secretion system protein VirB4
MSSRGYLSNIFKNTLARQGAWEDFIPQVVRHINDHFILYEDGKIAAVVAFDGVSFEGVNDGIVLSKFQNQLKNFNALGKTLGDRLGLTLTMIRKETKLSDQYDFKNPFSKQFSEKYLKNFQGETFYHNTFYVTLLIKPNTNDLNDAMDEAQKVLDMFISGFRSYDPSLLKTYQNEYGTILSEPLEFLAELLNYEKSPMPLLDTPAYQYIANSKITFGGEVMKIDTESRNTVFATAYDLKEFGNSRMKMLIPILSIPCEFVFTQSFNYINSYDMQKKMSDQLIKLTSANDKAIEQQDEIERARGDLQAGYLNFGEYSSSLIVFGKTDKAARQNGTMTAQIFLNAAGFMFVQAELSMPQTFLWQLPNAKNAPRPSPKSTINIATSFEMWNYAQGKEKGNPLGDGSAVMPLKTQSGTLFNFNFHYTKEGEDNTGDKIAGHTLIFGSTGTGKTTLQTSLLSFLERFNPYLFAIDLDSGMEIFIKAIGGQYFKLENGISTGLNPFQLPDTPANRQFLYDLVEQCAGVCTESEKAQIQHAVNTVMSMETSIRRFGLIIQNLPPSDADNQNNLTVRLLPWVGRGRYAAWLDNPKNLFNPEDFYRIGFDCKDILKEGFEPTSPVLSYLFYLKEIMLGQVAKKDGILCSVVEEFWLPAKFPLPQALILKALKAGRKLGEFMILVSQSPNDVFRTPDAAALIEQTATKIFLPNPDAEYKGAYESCGVTQKEFEEIKALELDSRAFLIKQSRQSCIAKLDLYGFSDEIAVLSGSSTNVLLARLAQDECGDDPDRWLPRFYEMKSNPKQYLINP